MTAPLGEQKLPVIFGLTSVNGSATRSRATNSTIATPSLPEHLGQRQRLVISRRKFVIGPRLCLAATKKVARVLDETEKPVAQETDRKHG
jgi:hypothetical protein